MCLQSNPLPKAGVGRVGWAQSSLGHLPGPLLIIYRGESSNICLDSVSKSTSCLLPPDLPLCILSRAWSHLRQLDSSSWAVLSSRLSNGLSFSFLRRSQPLAPQWLRWAGSILALSVCSQPGTRGSRCTGTSARGKGKGRFPHLLVHTAQEAAGLPCCRSTPLPCVLPVPQALWQYCSLIKKNCRCQKGKQVDDHSGSNGWLTAPFI